MLVDNIILLHPVAHHLLLKKITDSTVLYATHSAKSHLKVSPHHTRCFDQQWSSSAV
jgi:hypothetical protein